MGLLLDCHSLFRDQFGQKKSSNWRDQVLEYWHDFYYIHNLVQILVLESTSS